MTKNISLPSVTLVLGGARSGKSRYAENLIEKFENPVYLATAESQHRDDRGGEMAARIAEHRQRRGSQWKTVEEPVNIICRLNEYKNSPVLVDCMTLWLANIMSAGLCIEKELEALAECLEFIKGPLVLVSNEVGQGIIPNTSMARSYVDNAGRMNQRLATCADQVVIIQAGLPQKLKDV